MVEPGDVATFSVLVSDTSGASYQWKFNGVNISGATGDSLLLTNVSAANQGQYSVVMTNSVGSVTSIPAALTLGKNGDAGDPSLSLRLVAYSDVGGTVTVAPTKLSYDPGDSVTLTATPAAASGFAGWAGDLTTGDLVATTNPVSFVMNGNRTVRAKFASAVPPPPGLVAFWRGETDATDAIGGHNGSFYSGTSIVAPSITPSGKVGSALNFDGTVHVRVRLRGAETAPNYGGGMGVSHGDNQRFSDRRVRIFEPFGPDLVNGGGKRPAAVRLTRINRTKFAGGAICVSNSVYPMDAPRDQFRRHNQVPLCQWDTGGLGGRIGRATASLRPDSARDHRLGLDI
jgi:hypothetical protein